MSCLGNPVLEEDELTKTELGIPFYVDIDEYPIIGYPTVMVGGGFFLFDWIKKIFTSPKTKKIAKGVFKVAKKVAPVLEKAVVSEVARTGEKGQAIVEKYQKARKLGEKAYKLGEKVYGAVKGSGLNPDDPAYNLASKIESMYASKGSGLRLAGYGKKKKYKYVKTSKRGTKIKRKYKKGGALGIAGGYSKGGALGIAGGGMMTEKEVRSLITKIYMPQLLHNLKASGIKIQKKFTKAKKSKFGKGISMKLKKIEKRGGALPALLAAALPSLIPMGMNLASEIVPLLTNLLTARGQRIGRGATKELKDALGKEIAKLIHKRNKYGQTGSGFLDFLKRIGSTVANVVRKIFPVAKRVAKVVVPVLEPAVMKQLAKTEKGRKIADVYQKGKKIATKGYKLGKKIKEAYYDD